MEEVEAVETLDPVVRMAGGIRSRAGRLWTPMDIKEDNVVERVVW